ncbi:MAG: hypothetical protein HYU86_07930 [Chloroflexi bacterium]|nr:hypothetical protein [Chloroflexota bacterium]
MQPKADPKKYRCPKCARSFTSLLRLQHHQAAEHAPKVSADIPTTRDILHRPRITPKIEGEL